MILHRCIDIQITDAQFLAQLLQDVIKGLDMLRQPEEAGVGTRLYGFRMVVSTNFLDHRGSGDKDDRRLAMLPDLRNHLAERRILRLGGNHGHLEVAFRSGLGVIMPQEDENQIVFFVPEAIIHLPAVRLPTVYPILHTRDIVTANAGIVEAGQAGKGLIQPEIDLIAVISTAIEIGQAVAEIQNPQRLGQGDALGQVQ